MKNEQQLKAFWAAKAEIEQKLARITKLAENHFCVHPDEVGWGHVADLGYTNEKLKELSDRLFKEGEYAE